MPTVTVGNRRRLPAAAAPGLALGALAGVTAAGPLLAAAGASTVGLRVAVFGLLLTAAATSAACALRAGRQSGPDRAPWVWLAVAGAVQTCWLAGMSPGLFTLGSAATATSAPFGDLGHLLAAPLIAVALLRLPVPAGERPRRAQTLCDAAVAALALSMISWELALPASIEPGGAGAAGAAGVSGLSVALLVELLRPGVNVLLGSAVVVILIRTRHAGGLALPAVLGLAAGGFLLASGDTLAAMLGDPAAWAPTYPYLVLAGCGQAAIAYAALHPAGGDRSPDHVRARQIVAVIAPGVPLVLAGGVVLWSLTRGERLGAVTTALGVVLLVTLIASSIIARVEALETARTLEQRIDERTRELDGREKWFRSLVQNSSDVITVVDVKGVIRYQSLSADRVLGHDPGMLVGTNVSGLLKPADAQRLQDALAAAAATPGSMQTVEFPVWHRAGHWCDTETTVTSLVADPDIHGVVLNTRDVSERRQLEQQLTRQAYSDGLTGLANRALFRARAADALERAQGPRQVAVLFLDLNGFKAVNDGQGHAVGDQLLALVAQRLRSSVRPGDLVARLGGDEFGILVADPDAERAAVWVADRVRRVLEKAFSLDGREVRLGASTGIAVNDTGEETADQLLRNADLAMYRAKSSGQQAYVRFEDQMHRALLARVQAEQSLRSAITSGDLTMHYQPVVHLPTGRVVGVEALVRWAHAERGLISPAEFIALAEQTGLVHDIGAWALAECCRQGVRWQRYAPAGGVFGIAVNVSARQLTPTMPRMVRDALAASGLPASALTLEMTESVLMERTDENVDLLRRLKSMGVRVAVDDFGTGYSSLSYLSRFPVDLLKIDRTFVEHVGRESPKAELTRTIVALGRSLRLSTVAEGIESREQLAALREMGCELGQGYLFARPLPVEDLEALLDQGGADISRTALSRPPTVEPLAS